MSASFEDRKLAEALASVRDIIAKLKETRAESWLGYFERLEACLAARDVEDVMREKKQRGVVPADPSQWSEASQRSVSAEWTREYHDIEYSCWHCKAHAIFSAEDQKRTYEVKKAPIDQRRILCTDCWKRSLVLAGDMDECQRMWAESKPILQKDTEFLSKWLALLEEQERYVRYRPNTAIKGMLRNLLEVLAEQSAAGDARNARA